MLSFEDDMPLGLHAVSPSFMPAAVDQAIASSQILSASEDRGQGAAREYRFAENAIPCGVLGLNASNFTEHLQVIANRRCRQIGIEALYSGVESPLPMDE